MSEVIVVDFIGLKRSQPLVDNPEVVIFNWYQDCWEVELVCIDCLFRWEDVIPETMPTKLVECKGCRKCVTVICQP